MHHRNQPIYMEKGHYPHYHSLTILDANGCGPGPHLAGIGQGTAVGYLRTFADTGGSTSVLEHGHIVLIYGHRGRRGREFPQ